MPYKDINKAKECMRRSHLRLTYGITIEEYNEMLLKQDGKCKLCGCEPKHNWRSLHVDHDHENNKIRGLLCRTCNRYIVGGVEKIGLNKISNYINQHK